MQKLKPLIAVPFIHKRVSGAGQLVGSVPERVQRTKSVNTPRLCRGIGREKRPGSRVYPGVLTPFIFLLLFISGSCTQGTRSLSKSVIENQIRTILEVPVTEYVYREVLYIGKEARFLGIKHMDKRLLFSVNIVLEAGFDLTKGLEIRKTQQGIHIILPEPEILETDVDENSIHQYFVKEWGGKITRLDYYDELNKKKAAIKVEAVHRGILVKARENGEKMITGLFESLGIPSITISYKKGDLLQ